MPEQSPDTGPRFFIKGQYIKDLSFENPHAPGSLFMVKEKPTIDVAVDLKAERLQENAFETMLVLSCHAKAEGNTLFLVELTYCGIFQLQGIPIEQVDRLLFVDAPFLLFPFARRVIADVTRDGGFPPLLLEPVDFMAMYAAKTQASRTS